MAPHISLKLLLTLLLSFGMGMISIAQLDSTVYRQLNRTIRNKPQKAVLVLENLRKQNFDDAYSRQQLHLAEIKIHTALGEYDKALRECIIGLDTLTDTIDENYIDYLTSLGNIYYFSRQRQSAIDCYHKALRHIERKKLKPYRKTKLHSNLGGMYAEEGLYEKSEFHLRASIALHEQSGDEKASSIPYRLLGTNYWMQERYEEARPILISAIARAYANGDSLEIAGALLFYGDLLEKLDQVDSAVYYYQKGLAVVEGTDNPDMTLEAYKHLKDLYPRLNDFKMAYTYANSAYQLQNVIYQKDLADQISQMKIKYETDQLIEKNKTQLAQLESEKVKSRLRLFLVVALVITALFIGTVAYVMVKQQRLKRKTAEQNSIIKLQEERLRISRELHDNIGAQITVIISSLDNLEWQSKRKTAVDHEQIQKLSDFTRKTMQELRETVWAMKKESITSTELDIRIRDYINQVGELCPAIKFSFEGAQRDDFSLDPAQGVNLYRIVQEAVQNAIKHGQAKTISIRTFMKNNKLAAEITDDGCGFDLNTVTKGNGLLNMQNRALQNEITLQLETKKGKGTKVLLEIP